MDEAFFLLHGLLLSLFLFGIVKLQSDSATIAFGTLALFFTNFFFQKWWLFHLLPATTGIQYITAFMLLFFFHCERAGKKRAIYTLGVIFFYTTFTLFTIKLHLLYVPAPCDSIQRALREAFSEALALFASSIAVLLPLQFISLHLWGLLRHKGIPIAASTLILTSLLQLIDTAIFILIVESPTIRHLIEIFLFKLFALALFVPLITYFERSTTVLLTKNE